MPQGDAAEHTAHSLRTRADFHRINQRWLLRPSTVIADAPPAVHQYTLRTPAEKYRALADGNLGVGGIAVLQWVKSTSDGGEAVLSKPVALVLGPLVVTPQLGHDVGHDLETIGLTYAEPVLPLGQLWSSRRIYPLISPMFRDTRAMDSEKLLNAWSDWNSVYQFDHGLRACY